MKKRWTLAAVLAVTLCVACFAAAAAPVRAQTDVWDGVTVTQPTKLTVIDNVYYYEISTAEELAFIAQTGGEWLDYNYILTNDIVLNSAELTYDASGNLTVDASVLNPWTPIKGFTGIFNGNGFSVSGVYVSTSGYAGFFSYFEGAVYDLTIKNAYICASASKRSAAGGIVSYAGSPSIEIGGCKFYGVVVGVSSVGGIVGNAGYNNVSIWDCENYGDIFASENNAGGICGYFGSHSTVKNCVNEGSVYAAGNYAGGIMGGTSATPYQIWGCVNKGNVTGNKYVAGISPYGHYTTISNCGNTGDITGTEYVGGLLGTNNQYDSEIVRGYNTGTITGTDYVGGIAGYITNCDLTNAYNIGNVNGVTNTGGVAGYSDTVWGRGAASGCAYLKTETTNAQLNGFGNAEDADGIVNAKDASFFCVNPDRTLNVDGHTYSETVLCDTTCEACGYERSAAHTFDCLECDDNGHWYACACGEKSPEGETPHTWPEQWEQMKTPTVEEPGLEERKCTVCGHKQQRELAKLEPAPTEPAPTEPEPPQTQPTEPEQTEPTMPDTEPEEDRWPSGESSGGSNDSVVLTAVISAIGGFAAGLGVGLLLLKKKK